MSDLAAWEAFATDVLGLAGRARAATAALALRMDDRAAALLRRRRARPTTSPCSAGRSTTRRRSTRWSARLRAAGVDVARGTRGRGARAARVRAPAAASAIPAGIPLEIFYGPELRRRAVPLAAACARASSPTTQGLGHVVVGADEPGASTRASTATCSASGSAIASSPTSTATTSTSPSSTPTARHHSLAFGGAAAQAHPPLHARGRARWTTSGLALRPRARAPACASCRRWAATRTTACSRSTRRRRRASSSSSAGAGATVDDATWEPTDLRSHQRVGAPPAGDARAARSPRDRRRRGTNERTAGPGGQVRRRSATGCASTTTRPGEGPAVLFLHGSGPGRERLVATSAATTPSSPQRGFRAIVPDTLGFGYSSKPDDVDYTLDFLVGAVERFLDGARRRARAPSSATRTAARWPSSSRSTQPERVTQLVLMAPGGLEEREAYMKMDGHPRHDEGLPRPRGDHARGHAQGLRAPALRPVARSPTRSSTSACAIARAPAEARAHLACRCRTSRPSSRELALPRLRASGA